ncbi:MAG: CopD family protein, partial [Candidatus Nanopelagicales bacterium]|nr:CopD family protein [Candidatus Nanopelagicales bacterium]
MTATTATGGPTVNQAQGQQPQAGRLVFAFGLLVVLASLAGLLISGGGYQPAPNGLPDAGPVVSWLLPVATSLVFVAAMFTAGWLLHAAFLDADARKGLVSNGGRRSLVRAGIAAGVWVVLALIQAALTLSEVLGVSISEALAPDLLRTYAWDITGVRTVVVGALLALIVSVCSFFTLRLTTATALGVTTLVAIALPALAGHAAGLGNHAIALVNGVAHVVAATVWVGGLIALGTIALPRVSQAAAGVRAKYVSVAAGRFSQLALACVVVLGISGFANAYTRLGSPADLLTSGYGRLVVIKTLLLAGLILAAARIRGRILPKLSEGSGRRSFAKIAVLELGLMALATGLGVALSLSAPTRVDVL